MTQKSGSYYEFYKSIFPVRVCWWDILAVRCYFRRSCGELTDCSTVFCSHANTPWSNDYTGVGNDALMALFFLYVWYRDQEWK